MILLRDLEMAGAVPNPEIRLLALRRFEMLSEEEPFDSESMGYFIVVEPGDTATQVSDCIGFDVLANRFSGIRFDQPGFCGAFELLEEHATCYEIVFVISDDGYGVEVFVPKEEGVDQDLLSMCSMHSTLSAELDP